MRRSCAISSINAEQVGDRPGAAAADGHLEQSAGVTFGDKREEVPHTVALLGEVAAVFRETQSFLFVDHRDFRGRRTDIYAKQETTHWHLFTAR